MLFPITQIMVTVKRTYQLSLVLHPTPVRKPAKLTSLSSTKAYGLVPSYLILSSTRIRSASVAFLYTTTHSTSTPHCALNIRMLPSHSIYQGQTYTWTLALLLNTNWTPAHTFILHRMQSGIPRLFILHQHSLWRWKYSTMAMTLSQDCHKFLLSTVSRPWWKLFTSSMIPRVNDLSVPLRPMFLVLRLLSQRIGIQQSLLKNLASDGVLDWLNPNKHFELPLNAESVQLFCL